MKKTISNTPVPSHPNSAIAETSQYYQEFLRKTRTSEGASPEDRDVFAKVFQLRQALDHQSEILSEEENQSGRISALLVEGLTTAEFSDKNMVPTADWAYTLLFSKLEFMSVRRSADSGELLSFLNKLTDVLANYRDVELAHAIAREASQEVEFQVARATRLLEREKDPQKADRAEKTWLCFRAVKDSPDFRALLTGSPVDLRAKSVPLVEELSNLLYSFSRSRLRPVKKLLQLLKKLGQDWPQRISQRRAELEKIENQILTLCRPSPAVPSAQESSASPSEGEQPGGPVSNPFAGVQRRPREIFLLKHVVVSNEAIVNGGGQGGISPNRIMVKQLGAKPSFYTMPPRSRPN